MAEYICIKNKQAIIKKPVNLDFKQATATPFGASTALHFLKLANIQPDEEILINGASGAVGTFAIQIAKYFGAKVTAISNGQNELFVRSLGADNFIDYKKEDFRNNNKKYDIIMDAVGNLKYNNCKNSLNPKGRLLSLVAGLPEMIIGSITPKKDGKKFIIGTAGEKKEDLLFLNKLILENKLKPFIDKEYQFEKLQEAHAYVELGRKKGSVIVNLN